MARGIVQLGSDMYVEWSSVCDAPISHIMTRKELIKLMLTDINSLEGIKNCIDRILRLDKNGTTYIGYDSNESFFNFNRAGKNEETLSRDEIIEALSKEKSEDK